MNLHCVSLCRIVSIRVSAFNGVAQKIPIPEIKKIPPNTPSIRDSITMGNDKKTEEIVPIKHVVDCR